MKNQALSFSERRETSPSQAVSSSVKWIAGFQLGRGTFRPSEQKGEVDKWFRALRWWRQRASSKPVFPHPQAGRFWPSSL